MSSRVRSRAHSHADRSGDPLDGLVNMFDLAIVAVTSIVWLARPPFHFMAAAVASE